MQHEHHRGGYLTLDEEQLAYDIVRWKWMVKKRFEGKIESYSKVIKRKEIIKSWNLTN